MLSNNGLCLCSMYSMVTTGGKFWLVFRGYTLLQSCVNFLCCTIIADLDDLPTWQYPRIQFLQNSCLQESHGSQNSSPNSSETQILHSCLLFRNSLWSSYRSYSSMSASREVLRRKIWHECLDKGGQSLCSVCRLLESDGCLDRWWGWSSWGTVFWYVL